MLTERLLVFSEDLWSNNGVFSYDTGNRNGSSFGSSGGGFGGGGGGGGGGFGGGVSSGGGASASF